MQKNNEEERLLKKMRDGVLDGIVGNNIITSGGSTVWTTIKGGNPIQYKQGPGSKFFDGKENEHVAGKLHVLKVWESDDDKIGFLQKFGWLLDDKDVQKYSSKFKKRNR